MSTANVCLPEGIRILGNENANWTQQLQLSFKSVRWTFGLRLAMIWQWEITNSNGQNITKTIPVGPWNGFKKMLEVTDITSTTSTNINQPGMVLMFWRISRSLALTLGVTQPSIIASRNSGCFTRFTAFLSKTLQAAWYGSGAWGTSSNRLIWGCLFCKSSGSKLVFGGCEGILDPFHSWHNHFLGGSWSKHHLYIWLGPSLVPSRWGPWWAS